MSEVYEYTKVLDPEVLAEAIKLRTTIRSVFVGVNYSVNADGSAPTDNVQISFSRALNSSEQDEITAIINAIGPTYDLMIRKGIEQNTMHWAMEQGRILLAQFASNNLYRGKTQTQINELITNYPVLVNSLLTGSLTTAYITFSNMSPDSNISQEEIDEFTLRIAIVIGL